MFRNIGFGAAAALAVGALAIGCSDDGDTVISGSTLRPDAFPGSSVDVNNVADDQRAFTPSGQNIGNQGEIYWNVSNGMAMSVYTTEPDDGSQDDILWVALFDGSAWSTPVEIRGEDEDANSGVNGFKFMWINTTGSLDTEGAARNGDGILLFTRNDRVLTTGGNPVVGADEDSNRRLYATYFDVSERATPASGTRVGGWNTVATIVDFDNQLDNLTGDPAVSTFGFVSDSLHCTHEFSSGTDEVDSGDLTTFVHIFWRKDPNSGTGTSDGERYHSVFFDINGADNLIPDAGTGSEIDLPTGFDSTGAETVNSNPIVHNGVMIYNVSGIVSGTAADTLLGASIFGTTANSTEVELSSNEEIDNADTAEQPDANDVYGPDHGLAQILAFYAESGFVDVPVTTGDRAGNRDLMLAELTVSSAGAIAVGTNSPVEIDAFTGTIDLANVDTDAFVVRDGVNGAVSSAREIQTRINRTGEAIFVIWGQDNNDITDTNDTTGATGTDQGALDPNIVPFFTVVQTRLDATDARTVDDAFAAPQQVGALESTAEAAPFGGDTTQDGQVQGDAFDFQFQEGLAQGQATSQADGEPCDRGCNFQGNNRRVSVLFQQSEDLTGTAVNDDNVLYLNSFTFVPSIVVTTSPTFTDTNADDVETLDSDYNFGGIDAFAVDAGDDSLDTATPPAPTAAAGRVLVFFVSNANNETTGGAAPAGDDGSVGNFSEPRLFVSEQSATGAAGTKLLVSSDETPSLFSQGSTEQDAFLVDELEGVTLVPVNEDTVNTPNYSGTTLHVFWTEARNLPGSGNRLMTRSHDQTTINATTPVAAPDRFTPPLSASAQTTTSEDPVQIDLAAPGDLLDIDELTVLREGSTVGVYFDEDDHVWYSETPGSATGHPRANGLPDPQLVDNDTEFNSGVDNYQVFFQPDCDNLSKSQVVYLKEDANTTRAFLRFHN